MKSKLIKILLITLSVISIIILQACTTTKTIYVPVVSKCPKLNIDDRLLSPPKDVELNLVVKGDNVIIKKDEFIKFVKNYKDIKGRYNILQKTIINYNNEIKVKNDSINSNK